MFGLTETKYEEKKVTSSFLFSVLFLPLKLEPNVPLRGREEGACPTDTGGERPQRGNKGMYTVGVRACVCMSACV